MELSIRNLESYYLHLGGLFPEKLKKEKYFLWIEEHPVDFLNQLFWFNPDFENSHPGFIHWIETSNKKPRYLLIFNATYNHNSLKHLSHCGYQKARGWPAMELMLSNLKFQNHLNTFTIQTRTVQNETDYVIWKKITEESLLGKGYLDGSKLEQLLGRNDFCMYISSVSNIDCCTMMVHIQNSVCGLYLLGTLPNYRKKGSARATMLVALADAISLGCHTAILQTTEIATPLHLSLGFRQVGECEVWEYQSKS